MEEIWKSIEGYYGLYEVSNLGRVRSLKRTVWHPITGWTERAYKIRKLRTDKNGYVLINLCKNGNIKTHKIHRLVATAFLENKKNEPTVNHINEIKSDNRSCNLEWCSFLHNNKHGSRKELYKKMRKKVGQYKNGKLIKIWDSGKSTEKDGFCGHNVCACARGVVRSHKGYQWKYI